MIADGPGETTSRTQDYITDATPRAPELPPGLDELAARFVEIAGLADDWDDYGARSIDRRAILLAARFIKATSQAGLPAPEVFPIPNGGVQLEWTARTMELELEIEPGGATAVFVGDDAESGRRFDGEIPRDSALFRQAVATIGSRLGERPAD